MLYLLTVIVLRACIASGRGVVLNQGTMMEYNECKYINKKKHAYVSVRLRHREAHNWKLHDLHIFQCSSVMNMVYMCTVYCLKTDNYYVSPKSDPEGKGNHISCTTRLEGEREQCTYVNLVHIHKKVLLLIFTSLSYIGQGTIHTIVLIIIIIIIIIRGATGSDEPWPAEQPPLAVFPDCTRR
jgi:hypothetical protein